MKKIYFLVALFITFNTWGQQSKIDSLKKEFLKENDIKKQIIILSELNDLLLGSTLVNTTTIFKYQNDIL